MSACLGEAKKKDTEDDSKFDYVFLEHEVDHDDHGANQLKATTEEEEVETVGKHHHLGYRVLHLIQTGQSDGDADL